MSGRSEGPSKDGPPASPKVPCPLCGKPAAGKFAPFCSVRCADRDLGAWLKGGYVIPAAPDEAETPPENPGLEKED